MSHGKSLSLSQNNFVRAPDEAKDQPPVDDASLRKQKRRVNLYDAVAGRVNTRGFMPSAPYASQYRYTASSNNCPARPEEVLFRRHNAPIRYEETDFYFAHEALPSDRPLPSSDLLEAIHTYSADFYDNATWDRGQDDYRSMDETALIAMGILLEEMTRESLGETGDLVLVEGEETRPDESQTAFRIDRRVGRKRANTGRSIQASSGDELDSVVKKKKKRSKKPRLAAEATPTDMDTEADANR